MKISGHTWIDLIEHGYIQKDILATIDNQSRLHMIIFNEALLRKNVEK